ncbi:MAG: hypothetical protein AB1440_19750 [Pseudomonadota bacterium]
MKIASASLILALATLPAHAGSCSWSAAMEEDEGGSVMTASVCGGAKSDAHLMLTCFAKPVLSYDLGPSGPQLDPGISADFTFKAGGKSVTRTLQLEAMYNYFTIELAGPKDPLLALMRGKGEVTVSADKYGEAAFPLKGSGPAIGKVLAECGKGSGGDAD